MSDNRSLKDKLSSAFETAERFSWVYYLIVLAFLGTIRIGFITSQQILIDSILTITSIALGAQAINKFRNKSSTEMPHLQCLKCKKQIDPVGEWTCKFCGWKSTFPDN